MPFLRCTSIYVAPEHCIQIHTHKKSSCWSPVSFSNFNYQMDHPQSDKLHTEKMSPSLQVPVITHTLHVHSYFLFIFFSFFLWWSPKCSQFFGEMILTVFSFQQTLPEVCSEQDEMDFLMEALIIRYSFKGFILMVGRGEKG